MSMTAGPRQRPVIQLRNVTKSYPMGTHTVHALRGVSLAIGRGDFVAIMGASGSGKSTLMNIIGCLDVPDSGRYVLEGHDVGYLEDDELAIVRNRKIGFVFQSFNLIARTSAVQNVELPLVYTGLKPKERRQRALEALARVGLADRATHQPSELSGGEQQRVAIARALVTDPSVLLADEPTGALDSRSAEEVMRLVEELNSEGRTVLIITHESDIAGHAKRVVRLLDGEVVDDQRRTGTIQVVA